MKRRIITLILIIIWMIFVFYLSNQTADDSSTLSQGFLKTFLNLFNLKSETAIITETLIRKLAHFVLYTIGGLLIYTHIKTYNLKDDSKVILTQIIGTFYAFTDEFHQVFIPGRSGEIRDVLIDSLGIVTGIFFIVIIDMIREKKKEGNKIGE